jgi:hypothetical protein
MEDQSTNLEELFREKFREQYDRGIRVGIQMISKIIYDKLKDGSIPLMKRIDEVKRFCEIASNVEQKFNEIATKTDESKGVQIEQIENNENTEISESEPSETANN